MIRIVFVAISITIMTPDALALKRGDKAEVPFFRNLFDQKGFLFSDLDQKMTQKAYHKMTMKAKKMHNGPRDLVFMHVPYNFGHTIEKVAMFSERTGVIPTAMYMMSLGLTGGRKASWPEVKVLAKDEAEIWGHFNPDP